MIAAVEVSNKILRKVNKSEYIAIENVMHVMLQKTPLSFLVLKNSGRNERKSRLALLETYGFSLANMHKRKKLYMIFT